MRVLLLFAALFASVARPATAQSIAEAVTVTTLTGEFQGSGGVAVGPDGNVYVADFGATLSANGGNTIYQMAPDGTREVFATGFIGASGNAFDAEGNLYQSNIGGGYVSKVTPDGTVTTYASTGIAGPVGIAVDADGNVYNTNCQTPGRISKTTPSGVTTTFVQSNLMNCPNGLTIDDAGNLYTANFSDGRVVKITPQGVASVVITLPRPGPGQGNGHLTFANGVLYVCNWTGRIYEVTLDGQRRTLAGSGQQGTDDGPGHQASFYRPNGISASITGDTLYINQSTRMVGGSQLHPNVVRMITGVLQTLPVRTEEAPEGPDGFGLLPNAPNPFSYSTQLRFALAEPSRITLSVYDLLGRRVKEVVHDAAYAAGEHVVRFDAAHLPSGTYFSQLDVRAATGQPLGRTTRPVAVIR
ncbi:MAG: hypothetical protein RhofKO_35070 [Rhodothermales bacterium]